MTGTVTAAKPSAGVWRFPGYTPAEAAHMFEDFLELNLPYDTFWEWLMSYPPHGSRPPADALVENEIDLAILALSAFAHGTRSWDEAHRELLDARSRLTGLARF